MRQHLAGRHSALRRPFLLAAAVATSLLCMNGCGGGKDARATEQAAAQAAPQGGTPSAIQVKGHSRPARPAGGRVSVLVAPKHVEYGVLAGGLTMSDIAADQLKEAAAGAYTKIGDEELLGGTVTDLAGNGEYAIGRWTNGSDSSGGTYNANQGRAWAVGTPLVFEPSRDDAYVCRMQAATHPVAVNGNAAPGVLNSAQAHMRMVAHSPAAGSSGAPALYLPEYDLSLGYSIGTERVERSIQGATLGYLTNRVGHYTLASKLVGADARNPYLVVAYTFDTFATGPVSGLAVLACQRSR